MIIATIENIFTTYQNDFLMHNFLQANPSPVIFIMYGDLSTIKGTPRSKHEGINMYKPSTSQTTYHFFDTGRKDHPTIVPSVLLTKSGMWLTLFLVDVKESQRDIPLFFVSLFE